MLPIVDREGWRFGFVLGAGTRIEVVSHLKKAKEEAEEKAEGSKSPRRASHKEKDEAKHARQIHEKVVKILKPSTYSRGKTGTQARPTMLRNYFPRGWLAGWMVACWLLAGWLGGWLVW